MEDKEILALYNMRNEDAIAQTKEKYGKNIYRFAKRIVQSDSDAEECENDTYLGAWNSIPPASPLALLPYLFSICRHSALSRARRHFAKKRGGGEYSLVFEELSDCIADDAAEDPVDQIALRASLDAFLSSLDSRERKLFMRRYFYMCPVGEIASELHMSQSNVKVALFRLREKLKNRLNEDGFQL